MELLPDFSQAKRFKHPSVRADKNTVARDINAGKAVKVCKLKGYTIYYIKYPNQADNTRFYAINDKTNLVDMTVSGHMSAIGNLKRFKVGNLEGRDITGIKAYEFYRAILINMPIVFTSDIQSYGGMRTWQELSKYPDIEVFGWDRGPINIDPLDSEETHAVEDDIWNDPQDKQLQKILNIKLVAHKKITKRDYH